MDIKTLIEEYEMLPSELVGNIIQKVTYYEIGSEKDKHFNLDDHHSLDFGLQLDTLSGESYYLIWDKIRVSHDLKFSKGKITQDLHIGESIGQYDVSLESPWKELIGLKIMEVKSYWQVFGLVDEIVYPQDIQIVFENGESVVISALEIQPNGEVYSLADHISVFFDIETAKKYGAMNI